MATSFEQLDARLSSMERLLTEIKTTSKNSIEEESDDATTEEAEKILILGRKRIYAIQKNFTIKQQGRRLIFSRKELLTYVNRNIKNRKEK
jgi:hypothetical protein